MPAPVAILAASIFVTIPPLPTPEEPTPPTSTSLKALTDATSATRFAPACVGGAS
ncbi:unannotated protein [freshwater metagenome]|uniref:Unannotated protein n=1 Tax=freshwater metagenome TaxID=449393 RepID=A0A6J6B8K5_9ZZZZ